MSLAAVAEALGCSGENIIWEDGVCGGDVPRDSRSFPWSGGTFRRAEIDSRSAGAGDLFFCLPGRRADGHDFALAAARAGACAIVARRNPFAPGTALSAPLPPVFLVPDVAAALRRLAACHRQGCAAHVVGVTGSAGKTSVKEALAQVLAGHARTERSPLNRNNGIGLPQSMLNADTEAVFWVMEIGISLPGDMDELAALLRPDTGLILNAGQAHLEGLGDRGPAYYKARLLPHIPDGGRLLYSGDYPDLERAVSGHAGRLENGDLETAVFSFSREDVFCRAVYEGGGEKGRGRYSVIVREEKLRRRREASSPASSGGGMRFSLEAPFRGDMGAENVAAIVATALRLGLSPEEIRAGLASAVPPAQRACRSRRGAFLVLDDSYNANPLSAGRMLEAAREMAAEEGLPLILVMGDMEELGAESETAHELLGRRMAGTRPRLAFWKGRYGQAVRKGMAGAGYAGPLLPLAEAGDLAAGLDSRGIGKGLVLFKGSRLNRLEDLAEAFSRMCEKE
ncbi:MAG: UDP-N-acetylmuramoyl-tripeptide--D-alanyl-D-alanine ligase [Desulfovibrio sp.]|jgi:UDP-N-acetylmuramoyl-tripeptide--D-alanyl-D-alanine ligase|nr:UDP-N-acetylmuramoyl-tripeptide--D-alanyl-D-alanine ligase [Desulfovibrio sp.]